MTEQERKEIEMEILRQQTLNNGCSGPLCVFLLLAMLIFTAASCCPCRKIQTQPVTHDSIVYIHESHTDTVTRVIHDTLEIVLPHQTAERTTMDSTSHLENDYCISDARINPDGTLSHTLVTKDTPISVPVENTETTITNTSTTTDVNHQQDTIIKEVEKPLTRGERFLMLMGAVFCGYLIMKLWPLIKKLAQGIWPYILKAIKWIISLFHK